MYKDLKCLKKCVKGDKYEIVKTFCVKKKEKKRIMKKKARKVANKKKGCEVRGRVYKHPKCLKIC